MKKIKLFFIISLAFLFTNLKADADLENKLKEMQSEIDTLAELIEEGGSGEAGWWTKTSLGGYGEIHWSTASPPDDEKNATNATNVEVDIHRYVLFIGHEFNEYLSMNSEVEIEHAFVKDGNGELEMEQLYLEQNLAYVGLDNTFLKYGTVLMPVGITNEMHEPPTFYGVDRNVVEKELNANTWWETGIMLNTALGGGFDLTAFGHTGLETDGDGDIRDGRGKVFKQDGTNVAYTFRLKYTGIPGVEMGVWHNHQTDINNIPGAGNIPADLWGGHINMSPTEGLGFRAFGGTWNLDCSGTNAAGTQHACDTNGRSKIWGAFIEPSYRWSLGGPLDSSIGIGARAGAWNDKADEKDNASNKIRQYDLLLNYWLSPNAVLKVDYENQKYYADGKGTAGWNFGMGYQF